MPPISSHVRWVTFISEVLVYSTLASPSLITSPSPHCSVGTPCSSVIGHKEVCAFLPEGETRNPCASRSRLAPASNQLGCPKRRALQKPGPRPRGQKKREGATGRKRRKKKNDKTRKERGRGEGINTDPERMVALSLTTHHQTPPFQPLALTQKHGA